MRVVIKPAGIAVSLVILGVMLLVIFNYLARPLETSVDAPATTGLPAGSVFLTNRDFEGDYAAYQPSPGAKPDAMKAKVSGSVASGWFDNSDWADVTLEYAPDTVKPYGGSKSQRITVRQIGASGSQLQFAQRVQLTRGSAYTFSLYVRAEKETPLSIAIRPEAGGEPYANTDATAGPEWKRIEAKGVATGDGGTFVMVFLREPATIWVDDANLIDRNAATTTTPVMK